MKKVFFVLVLLALALTTSCMKEHWLLPTQERLEQQIERLGVYYKKETNKHEVLKTLRLFWFNNKDNRLFNKSQRLRLHLWIGEVSSTLGDDNSKTDPKRAETYLKKSCTHYGLALKTVETGTIKHLLMTELKESVCKIFANIKKINYYKKAMRAVKKIRKKLRKKIKEKSKKRKIEIAT